MAADRRLALAEDLVQTAAFPVDYNRSGLTSFLVLNGPAPIMGPVQLLTPAPK